MIGYLRDEMIIPEHINCLIIDEACSGLVRTQYVAAAGPRAHYQTSQETFLRKQKAAVYYSCLSTKKP